MTFRATLHWQCNAYITILQLPPTRSAGLKKEVWELTQEVTISTALRSHFRISISEVFVFVSLQTKIFKKCQNAVPTRFYPTTLLPAAYLCPRGSPR